MKTKAVASVPKCDFCGKEATYDAPTKHGPWANMCEACYKVNRRPNLGIGTRFKKRTPTNDNNIKSPKKAEILSSLEELAIDGMMECACPSCGEHRNLEPDFSGEFTCEGCGQTCIVVNPLF